jgi:hypothetical protein
VGHKKTETTVVICGSRDAHITTDDVRNALAEHFPNAKLILHGDSGTVDKAAEGLENEATTVVACAAEWRVYGRSAGPRRNARMAKIAARGHGGCLAFWDGESPGTRNMVAQANRHGLRTVVVPA